MVVTCGGIDDPDSRGASSKKSRSCTPMKCVMPTRFIQSETVFAAAIMSAGMSERFIRPDISVFWSIMQEVRTRCTNVSYVTAYSFRQRVDVTRGEYRSATYRVTHAIDIKAQDTTQISRQWQHVSAERGAGNSVTLP
jgi:hypothetical protein